MFYICNNIQKKTERAFMSKKLIFSFIAVIMMSTYAKAQRHELGIQLGISNLVGDIGKTNYVFQPVITGNFSQFGLPFYGGILYRMNFNPYQSLRFNLGYNHIQFSDNVAKEYYRKNRGLFGTNSIYEADVLFEYNLFPVNDEQKSLLSPYIFAGLGALIAETPQLVIENDFYRNAADEALNPTTNTDFVTTSTYDTARKMTLAIPFGVGLKYKFNYNWALFGEFMFRPTFSDSIDYSVIDEKNVKVTYNKDILDPNANNKSILQSDPYKSVADSRAQQIIENRKVGNVNSKDWVNTVSLGLTYSFGRPPCYCDY